MGNVGSHYLLSYKLLECQQSARYCMSNDRQINSITLTRFLIRTFDAKNV